MNNIQSVGRIVRKNIKKVKPKIVMYDSIFDFKKLQKILKIKNKNNFIKECKKQ